MDFSQAKKIVLSLTIIGLLLLVVWGVGTAVSRHATAQSPTSINADGDTYLPFINKPGTPPPQIAGCDIFPSDNIWNTPIDTLPVHPNSTNYINSIGAATGLHADFGSGVWPPGSNSPIGIPYIDVPSSQANVPINFVSYPDESDPGPYPIPPDAPIEGGSDSDGDRHVIVLDRDNCILYEMFYAFPQTNGSWEAANGAVYDLNSHALRPDGWTSADAAGLPIFPGLVRYDEVAAGEIRHAIRFTVPETQKSHVWPARHDASSLSGSNYPPMGLRLRLRADYDISGFSPENRVILQAFKTYGLILADNGSAWYISGVPDARWDNDMLHDLDVVIGMDFEVVDVSSLMIDPNSGQAAQP
ncbi:outermembrane protein [hydrothermal vent metagenome]|uniref:Outermembrane protein n=2 Tax=hydrothermal vent metagenome TaxID=652676 RepID=A0A3B0UP34_9ZZZZ